MHTPKMYVLVRLDLDSTYRCVQGAHALAHHALCFPEDFKKWNNYTLVFLGVKNLKELKTWCLKLDQNKKIYAPFWEPDLDEQLTALACYDTGELFRDLKTA